MPIFAYEGNFKTVAFYLWQINDSLSDGLVLRIRLSFEDD